MADLALTAGRREELAALLGDEHRLREGYPRVADYLDAAPRLPGTGDEQADAAFDLRFVHYLTGGDAANTNPYWEIVAPSVSDRAGPRVVDGGRLTGSARLGFAQTILQAAYAYAIPSPETIDWMVNVCAGRSVVELGAGRGYWAAQLATSGLNVEAYDSEPPGRTENVSFPQANGQPDIWFPVGDLDAFATRRFKGPDEALLLCWPPSWGNTMASDALAEFRAAGGDRFIYLGEPQGGKTGDAPFFDSLTSDWELISEDTQYVSWWNLSDTAQAWHRR